MSQEVENSPLLGRILAELGDVKAIVSRLDTDIRGNGHPGLKQRTDENANDIRQIKEWFNAHVDNHTIDKRWWHEWVRTTIMMLIIGTVGFGFGWVVWMINHGT